MSEVTYSNEDRIARIQITGAESGNRFTMATRQEVNEALRQYQNDEDAWIAVISTDGPDFSLGTADSAPSSYQGRRARNAIWGGGYVETWKPLVAAVQGQCRGEGLALALGCDLRVAEKSATFSADFTGATGDPDVLAVWLMTHVGLSTAMEMLWLNSTLDVEQAQHLGMVNRAAVAGPVQALPPEDGRFPMENIETDISVPDGDALSAAMQYASELLLYAPVTRNFQKEIAYRSVGVPFRYAQTLELGPDPYSSTDRIEGTRAFVENRRPVWNNS